MARRRSPRKTGSPSTETVERPHVVAKRASRGKKRGSGPLITVRHMTRRDIGDVWEFLKLSFRDVNAETVEYQRPRSRVRFEEVFEEEGIEQLLFEVENEIVAYAECSYEVTGSDNWINPRYFEKRDMNPLFVDELAVHPNWHGRGVGSFVLEQLHHLARVHGLNHLVLEVAENNERALDWYKKRSFKKLDAAIFMACPVDIEPELLPPRELPKPRGDEPAGGGESDPGEPKG
jgi:ribosomal protein S18 acetylase RimI-like enzyme